MKLSFSTFKKEDFPEYKSWYEDADLNSHLGPMDNEWLDCVLNEKDGCEYSVFQNNELIAVVGIKFPDAQHPMCFLTDFAIKPVLRSQNLGTQVLQELMKLHPLKTGETWEAVIDVRNPRAKRFFERNGWISSATPNEHGMFTLKLTDTNS